MRHLNDRTLKQNFKHMLPVAITTATIAEIVAVEMATNIQKIALCNSEHGDFIATSRNQNSGSISIFSTPRKTSGVGAPRSHLHLQSHRKKHNLLETKEDPRKPNHIDSETTNSLCTTF